MGDDAWGGRATVSGAWGGRRPEEGNGIGSQGSGGGLVMGVGGGREGCLARPGGGMIGPERGGCAYFVSGWSEHGSTACVVPPDRPYS